MNPYLKRSLLIMGLAVALVPVHELGHMAIIWLLGIQIKSFSMFSLAPYVETATPMPAEAFLVGPLVSLLLVFGVWFHYRSPEWKPYFIALIVTETVAGFGDFANIIRLLAHT